jgi:hypothetical protein
MEELVFPGFFRLLICYYGLDSRISWRDRPESGADLSSCPISNPDNQLPLSWGFAPYPSVALFTLLLGRLPGIFEGDIQNGGTPGIFQLSLRPVRNLF